MRQAGTRVILEPAELSLMEHCGRAVRAKMLSVREGTARARRV